MGLGDFVPGVCPGDGGGTVSPLGQHIARLLSPDRWTEWKLTDHGPADIEHLATAMRLGFYREPWPGSGALYVELDNELMRPLLGHWEMRRLVKATHAIYKILKRNGRERSAERAEQKIVERLMTEEERAIEDLLR